MVEQFFAAVVSQAKRWVEHLPSTSAPTAHTSMHRPRSTRRAKSARTDSARAANSPRREDDVRNSPNGAPTTGQHLPLHTPEAALERSLLGRLKRNWRGAQRKRPAPHKNARSLRARHLTAGKDVAGQTHSQHHTGTYGMTGGGARMADDFCSFRRWRNVSRSMTCAALIRTSRSTEPAPISTKTDSPSIRAEIRDFSRFSL